MGALATSPWATWVIAAAAIAGVILRPFSWPEFLWAVAVAGLLVALGLLPAADALTGVGRGTDVYLFLTGMMLLAELAREQGLFDHVAARAAKMARGSAAWLFTLVFAFGTVVTVFLSNDATAVVLTPAVAAIVKTADAKGAAALPVHLRVHRQRSQLRAAHLQPGQLGHLRRPHAAAAGHAGLAKRWATRSTEHGCRRQDHHTRPLARVPEKTVLAGATPQSK